MSQSDNPPVPHHREWIVIDHVDLFSQVLDPFLKSEDGDFNFKIAVLLEYIKSLSSFKINVEVRNELWHQNPRSHMRCTRVLTVNKHIFCVIADLHTGIMFRACAFPTKTFRWNCCG